ncbi:pentapeptide repeat-containing protein [Thermodesulfobacteriota bacterium]
MANQTQFLILSKGVDHWNSWRSANPDESIDLSGADLSQRRLAGVNLRNANLATANFSFARLEKSILSFANLKNSVLSFANLSGANLSAASLEGATCEDADLKNAVLSNANLTNTIFASSDLSGANLVEAQVSGANLCAANLHNTNFSSVGFDQGILLSTLAQTRGNLHRLWQKRYDILLGTSIRCKGVHAAAGYGSHRFIQFIRDQDYLEEFLETRRGKVTIFFWWLFADCGRSLVRWAGWSLFFALFFAVCYWLMGQHNFDTTHHDFNLLTLLYYSVVTFTTLGFGDIVPKTPLASLFVMAEVILGYVMLGGLISIFANKLARRGN